MVLKYVLLFKYNLNFSLLAEAKINIKVQNFTKTLKLLKT